MEKKITRGEAEKIIYDSLVTILKAYKAYYPNGKRLNIIVNEDFIYAQNEFDYGKEDHDYPISVSRLIKKGEEL